MPKFLHLLPSDCFLLSCLRLPFRPKPVVDVWLWFYGHCQPWMGTRLTMPCCYRDPAPLVTVGGLPLPGWKAALAGT
jgi:hypothetical protein